MMTNLKTLEKRAENAATRYEDGRSRLYRKDGDPIYGQAEMKERIRELEKERDAVLVPVGEEANAIMSEASDKLKHARNADPATLLTEDELARANVRRDFANDFAGSAELAELAGRLDSVLASGDRSSIYAHWTAAEHRRREVLRKRRESSVPGTGTPPKATPLDEALEGMRRFLGGERLDAETKRIREEEHEAGRVAALAGRLQTGARTAAQAGVNRRMARFRAAG